MCRPTVWTEDGLYVDELLRLPNTDESAAFWFKTTAKNARLCEGKRYTSYNNRWSDHVVSLDGGKVRFQLQADKPLETTATFNHGQWHHVVTTVGPGGQRPHMDGQPIATGTLTRRTRTRNRLGLGKAVVTVRVLGRALGATDVANSSR